MLQAGQTTAVTAVTRLPMGKDNPCESKARSLAHEAAPGRFRDPFRAAVFDMRMQYCLLPSGNSSQRDATPPPSAGGSSAPAALPSSAAVAAADGGCPSVAAAPVPADTPGWWAPPPGRKPAAAPAARRLQAFSKVRCGPASSCHSGLAV